MIKKKKKPINVEAIKKRNRFFTDIWNKRPHKCVVTNQNLGNQPNSMYFHHILPKNKYPEFAFVEENIVILHPHIHASVEMNMEKYEEINKLREVFIQKYVKN